MKNIYKFITVLTISLNCFAQSPIVDIEDAYPSQDPFGVYYKDTHNQLDSYEGTYIYTDANQTLKIVLQKKVLSVNMNQSVYQDLIIGEFQHIVNGVEKINTLSRLNANQSDKRFHGITANQILLGTELGCDDCSPNEKTLAGGLKDNVAHSNARIRFRKITVGGQPALKFSLYWEMRVKKGENAIVKYPSIAPADYILIKQ